MRQGGRGESIAERFLLWSNAMIKLKAIRCLIGHMLWPSMQTDRQTRQPNIGKDSRWLVVYVPQFSLCHMQWKMGGRGSREAKWKSKDHTAINSIGERSHCTGRSAGDRASSVLEIENQSSIVFTDDDVQLIQRGTERQNYRITIGIVRSFIWSIRWTAGLSEWSEVKIAQKHCFLIGIFASLICHMDKSSEFLSYKLKGVKIQLTSWFLTSCRTQAARREDRKIQWSPS